MKSNNTDMPLYLFHHAENFKAYELFGAHKKTLRGKSGYTFRVWAPHAKSVSIIGEFNNWNDTSHYMNRMIDGQSFELFIAGLKEYDLYKFCIETYDGRKLYKLILMLFTLKHHRVLARTPRNCMI